MYDKKLIGNHALYGWQLAILHMVVCPFAPVRREPNNDESSYAIFQVYDPESLSVALASSWYVDVQHQPLLSSTIFVARSFNVGFGFFLRFNLENACVSV